MTFDGPLFGVVLGGQLVDVVIGGLVIGVVIGGPVSYIILRPYPPSPHLVVVINTCVFI